MRYSSVAPRLAVPKRWRRSVQRALVTVMSLAQYTLVSTRGWAANSRNHRVRLSAKTDQLDNEIKLLREEIRIKDARMLRIAAIRRPHYQPTERLAILELRGLRGWSLAQTARAFHDASCHCLLGHASGRRWTRGAFTYYRAGQQVSRLRSLPSQAPAKLVSPHGALRRRLDMSFHVACHQRV